MKILTQNMQGHGLMEIGVKTVGNLVSFSQQVIRKWIEKRLRPRIFGSWSAIQFGFFVGSLHPGKTDDKLCQVANQLSEKGLKSWGFNLYGEGRAAKENSDPFITDNNS